MAASKKDPALSGLPSFEHYLSQIDLEAVADAILGPPLVSGRLQMADYEFASAKELVYLAAETWLQRDVHDLAISGIETEYIKTLPQTGAQKWKMILDLQGTLNGKLNVSKKYAGKKAVIDWKTSSGQLDKVWENRLLSSWQWRMYLYFTDADLMIYRGLNREGKTRELWIDRPANLEEDLIPQLQGVMAQRAALVASGLEVWPRKMPMACGSYGRECPYIEDCNALTMPRALIPIDKTLSYSGMDKLLTCPERYRRSVIEDRSSSESTEESNFGVRVHAGLAELWGQANKLVRNIER